MFSFSMPSDQSAESTMGLYLRIAADSRDYLRLVADRFKGIDRIMGRTESSGHVG